MKNGSWAKILLALATALLLSFSAMAEEGVTDTEIHIGQWGPQTGPAAPWGTVARGTGMLFDLINDQGGIHGRKIVYHMFDDAYNPAKTVAGVKQLQEKTGIFAWVGGVGTAPGLAVRDYILSRNIPWIGPSAGSKHWIDPPNRNLFAVYPLYAYGAKALVQYAVKQMGKKRVALLYQNDDYGKNGLEGARDALKKQGLDLVAEIPVSLKDTDMKPHVMRLRKAKPDVVILWVGPVHAIRIIGTGKAMKLNVQWMTTSTASDFPFMYKISKGLFKGVIAATCGELPDSDNPKTKLYHKAFKKYASKGERWGLFFIAGIGFAEPLVEALNNVGRDLTREKLVQELEKIKNFKGVLGKISYSKFDPKDPMTRQGQRSVFLVECLDGGKSKKLTDWINF